MTTTSVKYKITHTVNGVKQTNTCTAYNDAFYEIVSGKNKGCLIHRFSVLETTEIKKKGD